MANLRPDQVLLTESYTVAVSPGFTGYRYGLYWSDGVCDLIQGSLLHPLIGQDDFKIYPLGTKLRWQDQRPVVVSPDPEPKPVPKAAPKKRGRPKGSKSKPKDE